MPSEIASLIDRYAAGPDLLRNAIEGVRVEDQDARPVRDRWSIREVVCHLADSEIVYADRMKRVIAEEDPLFYEADPTLFGAQLFCQRRDMDTELRVVTAIRQHVLPILRALDEGQFQRAGRHSIDGTLTVQALLHRIVEHIPHHIRFIEEKRAALDEP